MKKTVGMVMLVGPAVAICLASSSIAQENDPPQSPCKQDDVYCDIVHMDPKPGAGGGGGGITDTERPPEASLKDLGVERLSTEHMRLPSFDGVVTGIGGSN